MKKILYTMFAMLGFANLTLAQVPSYMPTNGLIGYWPFNSNANDGSGKGHNGTVTGATLSSDRFGKINCAYNFNGGTNYIEVPHDSSFNFQKNKMTASFWIKTSVTTTVGNVHTLISKQTSSGANQSGFNIAKENSDTYLLIKNGSSNVQGWSKVPSNSILNTWHHLVYVVDSGFLRAYLNGSLIKTDTTLAAIGNTTQAMRFGKPIYSTLTSEFNGSLDDIAIWNRALTQQEIALLYIGCPDTFTVQPLNLSGIKGSNKTFSFTYSGTGNNYKWQSNSNALGWQNVPNAFQYSGATTNSLSINNLTVSNHNQLFRVISSKTGCADTSNIVNLTVSDVAIDSINLISLKTDTTNKGITIRQLQIELANKHDTLYIGSSITSDTLRIAIRTGISSASPLINSLKVYPNPAATLLYIDLEKPGYFIAKLSSITGQSIITPTSGTIDVSSLANGVYILTIYDSNNKLISTNKVAIVK
jgi:hypothetical protein